MIRIFWLNNPQKFRMTPDVEQKEREYKYPVIQMQVIANNLFVRFLHYRYRKKLMKAYVVPNISNIPLYYLEYYLVVHGYDFGRHFIDCLEKLYDKYDFDFQKSILKPLLIRR